MLQLARSSGSVQAFVPVAKPRKFATVLGASFSNKRQTMLPIEVYITAYNPGSAGNGTAGNSGAFAFVRGTGVELADESV